MGNGVISFILILVMVLVCIEICSIKKDPPSTSSGTRTYQTTYDEREIDGMYQYLDTTITTITDLSKKIDTVNKKPVMILFTSQYIHIISDQRNMNNQIIGIKAQGSGFWISDSTLVTARHVISEKYVNKKMLVFGDTIIPKIRSNRKFDISVLFFSKGTSPKRYHYELTQKKDLGTKFKTTRTGYSKLGKAEVRFASKSHILNSSVLREIKKSKWEKYPMALKKKHLGYIIYPIGFYEANNFGGGTSGGPVTLEDGTVCGVASGVNQTNDVAFAINGPVDAIKEMIKD